MNRFLQAGAIFAPDLGDLAEMRRRYTVSGTPGVVNTPLGKGLNFLTTRADCIACVGLPYNNLDFTSESFTFAGWINPTQFIGLPGNPSTIVNKGELTVDGYWLIFTTAGRLRFYTSQGAAEQHSDSTATFALNEWQHFAVTRSGASVRTYRNGTDITSVVGVHVNPLSTVKNFEIGRYYTDAVNFNASASMVSLVCFPRALSAAEVLALATNKFF